MAEGTLHGSINGVPTSFLAYDRLRACARRREGFRIASLDDLACMKLSAIVDRGSKKDFVDVFALCREHRPLHELLQLYARRFRRADVGHVMVALSYFADAEGTPMPRMLWPVTWPGKRRHRARPLRVEAGDHTGTVSGAVKPARRASHARFDDSGRRRRAEHPREPMRRSRRRRREGAAASPSRRDARKSTTRKRFVRNVRARRPTHSVTRQLPTSVRPA
jgi:hypothetical protein